MERLIGAAVCRMAFAGTLDAQLLDRQAVLNRLFTARAQAVEYTDQFKNALPALQLQSILNQTSAHSPAVPQPLSSTSIIKANLPASAADWKRVSLARTAPSTASRQRRNGTLRRSAKPPLSQRMKVFLEPSSRVP